VPRPISTGGVVLDLRAPVQFIKDDKIVVGLGVKGSEAKRLWAFPIEGGDPQPLGSAPEKDVHDPRIFVVSSDGRLIAWPLGREAKEPGVRVLAADGSSHVDIAAETARYPIRFSEDKKALFAQDDTVWPNTVERIDLTTKKATVVTKLGDSTRTSWLDAVMSEDTKTIAFSFPRKTSDLYVLEPPVKVDVDAGVTPSRR